MMERYRLTKRRIIKNRMRARARGLYAQGLSIPQVQEQVAVSTKQIRFWLRDILRPEDQEGSTCGTKKY